MNKILAFDLETTGLDPENANILSAYFVVLDEQFNALDELELFIKPNKDDGPYKVSVSALKINKIDLIEHDKIAITRTEAYAKLATFLHKNTVNFISGTDKLTPLAHNGAFDLSFIHKHLLAKETWEQYVSYRLIDTASIAHFLKLKKVIPENVSSSLGSLAKHFGIDSSGAHNAKFDVVMCVQILEKMLI